MSSYFRLQWGHWKPAWVWEGVGGLYHTSRVRLNHTSHAFRQALFQQTSTYKAVPILQTWSIIQWNILYRSIPVRRCPSGSGDWRSTNNSEFLRLVPTSISQPHFSLLTFERKLLLSTDDLCTLNSVLILTYPFASRFAAYLNTRPECFVCQKGILGSETCIAWKHVLLVGSISGSGISYCLTLHKRNAWNEATWIFSPLCRCFEKKKWESYLLGESNHSFLCYGLWLNSRVRVGFLDGCRAFVTAFFVYIYFVSQEISQRANCQPSLT